jgi:hypothetical protein
MNVKAEVKQEVTVGSVISYKCRTMTPDGIPILPIIYRIRYDLKWSDIIKIPELVSKKSMLSKYFFNFHKVLGCLIYFVGRCKFEEGGHRRFIGSFSWILDSE